MRTRTVALVGSAMLVAAGVGTVTAATSEAATSATVTVDTRSTKGTIPEVGQGLNMAVWDGHMNDADQPALLKAAGIKALRYPGGSYGDIYHWKDNTAPGGYVAPNTSFDEFMSTAKATGADPVLIANYGSGTAQEAADWVEYANKTKGYGVTYWEIGNEVYGNGHYGADWEKDDHADKGPKAYATNALEYISKMKAVDPSIKIGIVLTTPGNWPDGQVASGDSADWNNTVLSIVGGKADFGIVHWYPYSTSSDGTLARPSAEIATITSSLRTLYAKYNVTGMGSAVTEMNANFQNDSATAGLFAADSYLTWWENGVFNLDWWNLRNGSDGSQKTNDDGTTDYNDGGVVSSGNNGEPALNTPFPTYYGLAMAGQVGSPGDTLVSASSSSSKVVAHAVKTASGGVNVLLINEDLNNSATVELKYPGYTPGGTVAVRQWAKGATGITSPTQSSASSITVPAYSITLLKTSGGNGPAPTEPAPTTSAPTEPAPTEPAPTTSAPTEPAPTGSPSLTPTAPAPTTSAPTEPAPTGSPSLTPTAPAPTTSAPTAPAPTGPAPTAPGDPTPPPASSASCSVATSNVTWPGGMLSQLTVRNTGPVALEGWKLTFNLPAGQTVLAGWNAEFVAAQGQVTASNLSYDATIDAGSAIGIGYVAYRSGSAGFPSGYRLNGVACTVD